MTKKISNSFLLQQLYAPYKKCSPCPLNLTTEHNFVCGHGNPNSKIMFIGEAPGKHEDEQGIPFVGKSGMLLTKTLATLGVDRKDVFITNTVKCRPPQNRKPTQQESALYKKLFLLEEIAIIKPKIICTLGATALECLFEKQVKMNDLHGKTIKFANTPVVPVFHPAYVLRDPRKFSEWFEDLQKVIEFAQQE